MSKNKRKSEFISKEAEESIIQTYGHPVKDLIRILSDDDVKSDIIEHSQLVVHDFDALIKGLELYRQQLSIPSCEKDKSEKNKIKVSFICSDQDDAELIEKTISEKVIETLKSLEKTTSLEFFVIEGSDNT